MLHTVHLFPKGNGSINGGHTLCCGKTWAAITIGASPGSNTHTKNPNCSTDGVKCWDHKDWKMPDEPLHNPKVTCMICGFPRIPKGATEKDGTPIPEGGIIPNKLYIDGMLVKVFCEKHCPSCGQIPDNCACCKSCHHYPCQCEKLMQQAVAQYKPKAKLTPKLTATITMHIGPDGPNKVLCCGLHKQSIDSAVLHGYTAAPYDKNGLGPGFKWCSGAVNCANLPDSIHGFFFDLPQQFMCFKCSRHMKNCVCPEGPTDKNEKPIPLTTMHYGQIVTVQTGCMVPGWIARGQVPVLKHTNANVAWPNMKPESHDPVEWAADFYLYDAIMSGMLNHAHDCDTKPCPHPIRQMFEMDDPPVRREARMLQNQLIDEADLVFREYIDMACGGELRHHPSVGHKGVLNGNRSTAWAQWRDVRDLVGVQAILDMAELFIDCNATTGGVCGQRWRSAAMLLYARLTGKVPPKVFVDQVFTLVHNGGVFLNKLEWKGNHLGILQGTVLPAQAADDWPTLLDYASPTAQEVWAEAWIAMNRARIKAGVRPAPRQITRSISVCQACGFASFQGHRTWDCRKADVYKVKNKHDIQHYRARREHPYFSWDFKKFMLYDWGNENGPWYRCSLAGIDYTPARKLLDKTITIPEGKRTLVISDGDYNILKLPISKFKGQEWKIRDLIELHGMQVSIRNQQGQEVMT